MAGGSLSERHNGHQHSAGHRTSKLVFSTARESAFSQLTSMGHLPGVVLEPTRHVQGSSDDRSKSAHLPFGNENPLGFWIRPVAVGVSALHCSLTEAHGVQHHGELVSVVPASATDASAVPSAQ